MAKYTSAESVKLLRRLTEERDSLLQMESKVSTFRAAVGEDAESLRPEYSFGDTRKAVDDLTRQILRVKHAINIFNTTTEVGDTGMTIDEVLVYLPYLSNLKKRLSGMAERLPKERIDEPFGRSSNIIDYRLVNYDLSEAKKKFETVSEELSSLQTALDLVNSTETMEIEIG